MNLYVNKINEEAAKEILSWQYDKPYDFYNNESTTEALSEMLTEPYFSVFNEENSLVGFFCIGGSAQVPNDSVTYSLRYLDIGVGMRPDLTGQGRGTLFFEFVLSSIDKMFGQRPKRLTVAKFNDRAIHLYEKLGFKPEAAFLKGTTEFLIMIQPSS